ncbi:hypothetical protein [Microaceticoccus formicicus]|uniref:hypothetical protein n=1 Tax=Microaceticoccus formicicus TaxID=3118105 RepID=UPI003CD03226|nr:hypothetical protein VZL98_07915 [Peptoniphilaceae bacterium AMB_02]
METKVVIPKELKQFQIDEMYFLMEESYENLNFNKFVDDLLKKDSVILLIEDGKIYGFSTYKLLKFNYNGEDVYGIFSGDTIVHSSQAMSLGLQRTFSRVVKEYMDELGSLYWFLVCKGHKTYRYMSLYLNEYYPNYKVETPDRERDLMKLYAGYLYGIDYDEELGIIKNTGKNDYVRTGVSDADHKALRKKEVQFFVKANPGYINGDELVCIAEFKPDNMKAAFYKMVEKDD